MKFSKGVKVQLNQDLTRYNPKWKRGEKGEIRYFSREGFGSNFYYVEFENGSAGEILSSSMEVVEDPLSTSTLPKEFKNETTDYKHA